jgi:hypothetical protein
MRQICSVAFYIIPFLLLASIFLMSSIIQTNTVQAAPETIIEVDPDIISANVSETFTINIKVIDVQNLYSVEVTLYWNSFLLKLENIDIRLGQADGVLYNPIYIVENSTREGKYTLAAMSYVPAPSFNGSGNIVRITFNAINLGDSKFDLAETQLYDYPPPDREPRISMPIEHITIDGFFNIIPEILSTTILIILLILTTLAVVLSKKISKKTSQQFKPTFINIGEVTKDAG